MKKLAYLGPIAVVLGVVFITSAATKAPVRVLEMVAPEQVNDDLQAAVAEVDGHLRRRWEDVGLIPSKSTDELTVLRRLSLALHGTIPSLEEIRLFEQDTRADRLLHWTAGMLEDPRFFDYFAERLARSFVGVEQGQFLLFRRDRFLHWLSEELKSHTPYDEIVRQMITGEGVWTGEGEVNFLTSGYADGEFDPNKLAARSVRAFLGQRIDCAQCHDHPFDHWKQSEFEGLAAHFGKISINPLAGVFDNPKETFTVEDRLTLEEREVSPEVPFSPEWQGETKASRERLANWITHTDNQRFERAIANRVWGLLFGTPYVMHRPVDDLPDPDPETDDLLDILGRDFRAHGCDLRRLIQVIAASDVYRLSSANPLDDGADESAQQLELARDRWAVFPLIRLRPEQVIGAMLQANNVHTIDQNSHLITRTLRFFRERDFVDEFGDPGVDELQERSGTIPQALLRMNGKFAGELTEANPFGAPGRINLSASTPEKVIETAYLMTLTRRPQEEEVAFFREWIDTEQRAKGIEDLFWTLFNSPEFSWNH
ncbi:MAG: DUF1549 domain-containing protein [Planctomycetaceae bacterium]|nr:DUF1549 domain-containing protein [Planctomycetaceae bacterium]